ncbi:MAG: U32 family peptidase [Bacteroidaceae bacterium]|nr:U32 family peptidase [Bacteroidaceae bacterium]
MCPVELLSPARDLTCGIAAIDHGADAVYIGAARFGARAAAGNPTEDIQKLCDYAHRFGAKVYVAINTLLHEEEKEEARRLAWDVYRAGADALIVQDMFFCSLPLRGEEGGLPPIPLHASTQMDNRTAEWAVQLKELGFKQIVLARELSLEQIRSIHEAVPDVPLEAFVHGALCVSYSGKCYASEYCFGRSANRGECAQFCRLPFSLQDAEGHTLIKDKYLLSLRDMNRIGRLEEMLDAGVRSFKIEGRLKDVEYVKNVTAAYRQAIDAILERRPEFVRSSFGTSTYTFQPDLSRSFSRGNTEYFLDGRTNDLASPDTPKSRGREVGRVKEVRRDCIVVSSTESFSNGDGLCFFDEAGKLQGFRVNRAEGNHLYINSNFINSKFKIRKGDRLWRSFDQQWERLMSGQTAERRIAANILLEETEQGFRLTFTAEDGTERSEEFLAEHQEAKTDQTTSVKEVLGKLGNTPYLCKEVEVRFSQPWFIPRSTLAEWRRRVIEHSPVVLADLQSARNEYKHLKCDKGDCGIANPYILNGRIANPSEHEGRLMTCRFCIRHAWGQCPKNFQSSNGKWREPLYLVLGDGRRFRLEFDCKKCEMNVLK